jgi:drug/metabolite transporter (DMT)-like permease
MAQDLRKENEPLLSGCRNHESLWPSQGSKGGIHVLVYVALVVAQLSWGSTAIVHKIALVGVSPVFFCLVRELLAAPLLLAVAAFSAPRDTDTGKRKSIWVGKNWWCFCITGFCIFGDQFFTLLGIKLADPTSCATWQPSVCLFATALACSFGLEVLTQRKFLGITLSVAGSILMVVLEVGGSHLSTTEKQEQKYRLLGQLCFLCNCMCSATLVVYSKSVLSSNLGAVAVLAWSYVACAIFMLIANIMIHVSGALPLICDDCSGGSWHLPTQSLWAVFYSVIFASCLAYFLVLWANRYAPASTVSQFHTVQPVATILLGCTLIFLHLNPHEILELPGRNIVGGALVILGLYIANSSPASDDKHRPDSKELAAGPPVPAVAA